MRTVERTIVSALIFSKDGKIFQGMAGLDSGAVYADAWRIPGGGIEAGEDPVAALVREIKEEVGLDISACPIELVDDLGRGESEKTLKETGEHIIAKMIFLIYKVTLDKPASEVVFALDPDEFVEYRWTEVSELKDLKLTPPSQELFKRLGYI